MGLQVRLIYEFDAFRLDPAERQLLHNGQPVPLTPKAFDTLVVLVERGGHLVEKEELLRLVWAEAFVEEANLARCIHTLRKALGEEHGGTRYIETVPKSGYRFVADVSRVAPETAEHPLASEDQFARRETLNHHRFTIERAGNVLAVAAGKEVENRSAEPAIENDDNPHASTTEPMTADQAYQESRIYLHQGLVLDIFKSRAYLEKALRLDADYAPAHAALAEQFVREVIYGLRQPCDGFPKARAAIKKASALSSASADVYAMLGYVNLLCDWNFAEAERNLRKSLELNPHHALAHNYLGRIFMFLRRADEAAACLQRASDIDPMGLYHHSHLAMAYFLARKYDKVIESSEKALAVNPHHLIASQVRCWAWEQTGRADEAIECYEQILRVPESGGFTLRWLGYAYALAGAAEKARAVADKLIALGAEQYLSPVHLAMLYAELNEADQAIFYLAKAYQERDPWMLWIHADPRFDKLRSDVRFQRIENSVVSSARTGEAKHFALTTTGNDAASETENDRASIAQPKPAGKPDAFGSS